MTSRSKREVTLKVDATGTLASLESPGRPARHYNLRHQGIHLIADVLAITGANVYRIQSRFLTPVATCLGAAISQEVSESTRVVLCVERAGKESAELEFAPGGWLRTNLSLTVLASPKQWEPRRRPLVSARPKSRRDASKNSPGSKRCAKSRRVRRGMCPGCGGRVPANQAHCSGRCTASPGPRTGSKSKRSSSYKAQVKKEKARRARARYAGRPMRGVITVWNRRKR